MADLVLLNDTFASLPAAFAEEQRIRNGMQDILKLFLTRALSVALWLISIAFIGGFPFQPRQTSILTFLTVGVPALALATRSRFSERSDTLDPMFRAARVLDALPGDDQRPVCAFAFARAYSISLFASPTRGRTKILTKMCSKAICNNLRREPFIAPKLFPCGLVESRRGVVLTSHHLLSSAQLPLL